MTKKILQKGKALFLAYDQGIEHGPTDFNDKNVDPNYIINIAKKGKYNALILQKGIAEKYKQEIKKSKIPLIVKLNGKTNIPEEKEPYSAFTATVEAGTGSVFANIFPAKAEAPYLLAGGLTALVFLCLAIFPVIGGLAGNAEGVAIGLALCAGIGIVAAPILFALAAWVSAKI